MRKTITEALGRFVSGLSYEALPKNIIEKTKTCMINGIGIGISCYDIEFPKIARNIIKEEEHGRSREGSATIFCDGFKASVMGASFANSILFNGRVQEDTLGTSHPGIATIPVALAIAEKLGNSGEEIITAVLAGYEVMGVLDKLISPYSTPRGFRPSSIFGIFGTTSTASKLLNLSEAETINAIGFAAAFAGGTLESFSGGTMEWRFQTGVAIRDGIMASLIAKNGATAASAAIEGKNGFLNSFAGNHTCAEEIAKQLGKNWEIMDAAFKPYPVCALNQTPVSTMLNIIRKHEIKSDQVERIKIKVNADEFQYPGINYRGPFCSVGATLMSTPFCLALACVNQDVTLHGISQYENPEILSLIDRIEHIPDKKIPRLSCSIDVKIKGGKSFNEKMIISADYYSFDMNQDIKLIEKVTGEAGVDPFKIRKIISIIKDFDKAKNVKNLVNILAHCP